MTQPWASLVAQGHKRIETRSWRTNYRGPIAIHAAMGMPAGAKEFARLQFALERIPSPIPCGAIVATATLMGCRRTEDVASQVGAELEFGDFTPGRWAWFLTDIVALPFPIPCRGHLSLWIIPPEIAERLTSAVAV